MKKFELRLAITAENSTTPPHLQIRHLQTPVDAKPNALGMGYEWGKWEDVPIVIVEDITTVQLNEASGLNQNSLLFSPGKDII